MFWFCYMFGTRVLPILSVLFLFWTYTLKANLDLCKDLIIGDQYMSDEDCHHYHPERYK